MPGKFKKDPIPNYWEDHMKARLILVSLGLAVIALLSLGIQAQEQTKNDKDDLTSSQQQLANLFADFQNSLFKLQTKLARGTPEERKRAEDLAKVLDECKKLAINQEFSIMLEILRTMKTTNTSELDRAFKQSENLADRIGQVLRMLQDSKADRLSRERDELSNLIKELAKVIQAQQIAEQLVRNGKTDKDELGGIQKDVTKKTSKLEEGLKKFLDDKGKDKDGKGGEANPTKGDNKDAGKDKEGKSGEAKNDGSKPAEGAKGQTKNDGGKESQQGPKGETKPGEKKGNQPDKQGNDEPKAGAKAGEKSPDGKEPGAKKGEQSPDKKGQEGASKANPSDKAQQGKEGGAKDAGKKSGDPMKDSPQGAAKASEKQDSQPKDKQGSPDSSAKPSGGDPKAGGNDPKASASKAGGDPKAGGDQKAGGDAKAGDPGDKAGDSKPGDSKSGQGQAKDGGKAGGKGGDMGGDSPQADNKGGGGQPPPPPPPGGNKQNDDVKQSAKRVNEAGYDQKSAEEKIAKDQKDQAAKAQADAIQKLQDAQKQLEKLLRQIREDELERVLAALQARCEKMLMLQKQVLAGTVDTDIAVKRNLDKKPSRDNQIDSLKLADKEKEIVQEANKCIDILEAEGTAVAFPEVFQQLRQDMMHVQKRLELTDVAKITQGIEQDIIDTLQEMIKALKEEREKNQEDKDSKSKPGDGKAGKPGDQKLIKLIQELKMVRSLQERVNKRTDFYGKQFPNQEQAAEPQIVRELRNLSERQRRIQEIVDKIAKGDNK